MTDDLDRIMAVMETAFDPAFGEAWTRRQVSDSLILPNSHYLLAGIAGHPPGDGEPAAGFALSRCVADEEELAEVAWCDRATLTAYVPYPFFGPVQEHLDANLR